MRLQNNFLAGGRFDFVGHIGPRDGLSMRLDNNSDQNSNVQQSGIHEEKFNISGEPA
jgi:hypothetical protein